LHKLRGPKPVSFNPLGRETIRVKNAGQKLLDQLLTEDLSGVTFVRDYLQLQFNPPPMINVYSRCSVHSGAESASFGEQAFANLVIGQINKAVRSVSDDHEVLTIAFADDSRIEIPFGQGTFDGPEAFEFWGRDEHWGVWPG
jgi:hypothetical protein